MCVVSVVTIMWPCIEGGLLRLINTTVKHTIVNNIFEKTCHNPIQYSHKMYPCPTSISACYGWLHNNPDIKSLYQNADMPLELLAASVTPWIFAPDERQWWGSGIPLRELGSAATLTGDRTCQLLVFSHTSRVEANDPKLAHCMDDAGICSIMAFTLPQLCTYPHMHTGARNSNNMR